MELQLFAQRYNKTKFLKVKNKNLAVKPYGGLWTSTYTPEKEYLSGWIEWCISEQPNWIPEIGVIYEVSSKAKIIIIDNLNDLNDLFKLYGEKENSFEYLNFEKMSEWIDGLALTEEGQHRTRFSHPYSLYGWDCESTLWFNLDHLKFIEEISLKVVKR
jgi:hypothetical protein